MASGQSNEQKQIVERVMHEFKQGELATAQGSPVENPKQAIAIALHEAGSSNQESAAANRVNLRRTKKRERVAGVNAPSIKPSGEPKRS